MSPVGSTDESPPEKRLILRPQVTKSFIKGAIAIGVFSIFLNVETEFLNYLIFLAIAFGSLGIYMWIKHEATFALGEDSIQIKRKIGKARSIDYTDIYDISISQGILAKRFDCGSVYVILKKGRGSVTMMGGGTAERLEDVPNPNYIFDLISSRLGPFSEKQT
jgi:uncharacterized membrane protein YdbT with pleckstrin-like domain